MKPIYLNNRRQPWIEHSYLPQRDERFRSANSGYREPVNLRRLYHELRREDQNSFKAEAICFGTITAIVLVADYLLGSGLFYFLESLAR